ncbi:3049_t:CDS:2 [Diversispora eburnea]|uniref:3049_t:CDS:1 n=1 Tax=Diversispora eburnea TaxID=1213867 RepID=A0A9N8VA46_9GLOM|nr:3049_t:CDS:2 [Diversispora eburnea]
MQSHFTQPTIAANTSEVIHCVNNNHIDFDIYSQDTNSSDVIGNLSYPQELIPQGIFQEGYIDSPHNSSDPNVSANFNIRHQILQILSPPAENFCFTSTNQSTLSNTTSTSPQIGISKNEQVPYFFPFSPQPAQPLTVSDSINIINSPYINPLLLSPISNNTNNIHSTVGIQPGLSEIPFNINTPITPGLFLSPIVSYNPENENDQCFSNDKTEASIENITGVISPNSSGPSSVSPSASSSASPSVVEESISHVDENTTEVVNNTNTSLGGSPAVSSPNSPVTTPRLVAIRPRPQEEEDDNPDPPRRSKRQRNRSMSDNDDENDEENEEKKYNCPDCGRGFNRKFNMQTHRQTHDPNRVKPFACEHPNCGSRFTRKHDLKRHINGIHKGEKVHECTSCHKPFSRKDAWKRHITTCGKM